MPSATQLQEVNDTGVDELLERYQPLVRKVSSWWSRYHPAQREDIAQEISLAFWQVLSRRPDAPLNYLTAVANQTAHKCLSRGSSVDRALDLKRLQRWQVVSLDVVAASEDGDTEQVDDDKVRRHQQAREWESVVEDRVIAWLLYMEISERLSRMERRVLRARLRGYRNHEAAELLGLEYKQVKNTQERLKKKARALWNGNSTNQAKPGRDKRVSGISVVGRGEAKVNAA
ncbi:MAG: hypothetical protein HY672_01430 [Chloroflexi bacterium]|nr:hypothetical protein [Chloroflexota bacterium]